MLTVPGKRARKITESAHVDAHACRHATHSEGGKEERKKKKVFSVDSIANFPPRGHVHHNSRFLTKLGSALNRAAAEGRGDDDDVYEVEINKT